MLKDHCRRVDPDCWDPARRRTASSAGSRLSKACVGAFAAATGDALPLGVPSRGFRALRRTRRRSAWRHRFGILNQDAGRRSFWPAG